MFKETGIKTPEQEAGEQYQARLDQINRALELESIVFKPLEKSLAGHLSNVGSKDIDGAYRSIIQLKDWMFGCSRLANIDFRFFIGMKVMIAERTGQEQTDGLPEFSIPVIIFQDEDWPNIFKSIHLAETDKVANNDGDESGALFFSPLHFNTELFNKDINPFSVTGLIMTEDYKSDSNVIHEGMHFLDFNSPLRQGANRIIGEIAAFRQAKIMSDETGEITWSEYLPEVIDDYINTYNIDQSIDIEQVRNKILKVIEIISHLDELWHDSSAVTHILLNSMVLEDIEKWGEVSEDDLRNMQKK